MPLKDNTYNERVYSESVTIASGQTAGSVLDTQGACLVGLVTPAAMTGTSLVFNVGNSAAAMFPLHDRFNARVTLPIATGEARAYALDPAIFVGYQFVQVVSASSEGAARTLQLQMIGL